MSWCRRMGCRDFVPSVGAGGSGDLGAFAEAAVRKGGCGESHEAEGFLTSQTPFGMT
jgi:hypothetical protein